MEEILFPLGAGIVGIGVLLQVLGLVCFFIFYFRKLPVLPQGPLPGVTPGVTIVKPCHGVSDHEDLNFDSFFNQDYKGPLEIIFSVSEVSDSSVPVINKFIQRYPQVDAKLLISKTRKAYWQKIDAYDDGYRVAKHDIFIISDSDTIVAPDYVSKMVACLSEPGVSFVTTPQCDTGINNIPTAIKTLGNNCDVATFVSIMDFFVKFKKNIFWSLHRI